MPQHDLINPFCSAEKISLSLSHLFPEIHGPKDGLIFTKNVLFNSFNHFVSIFILDFRCN